MAVPNRISDSFTNVDEFVRSIEGINRSSFSFDGDRIKALAAAYALVSHLETPWDSVARLCMTEVRDEYSCSIKSGVVADIHASLLWEHR